MKSTQQMQILQLGAIGLAIGALAFGLAACSGSDTATPVEVVTSPPVAPLTSIAKYQLVLRNAATGALITDPTTVSLGGVNLVNLTGGAVNSLTVTNGLASFATAPGVAAGGTLNIATQSRAAGWSDGAAAVTVSAGSDVQIITINATNINRVADIPAAAPVAAAVASAPVAAGAITAATSAATPAKTLTGLTGAAVNLPGATVAIAANTKPTNAAGQAPSGALSVAIVQTSLATLEGLRSIPGSVAGANNNPEAAAMVTLTMQDAAGNRFTSFDKPVVVRVPLPAGTPRFESSTSLQVGDTLPVMTWVPSANEYELTAGAEIVQGPNGLVAEFENASFSSKIVITSTPQNSSCLSAIITMSSGKRVNVPCKKESPPIARPVCTASLNLTGRPAGNTDPLKVSIARTSGAAHLFETTTTGSSLSTTLPSVTGSDYTGSVVVTNANGTVIGQTNNASMCGTVSVALNFPVPATGSIVVSTREQCASGTNNRALPNVQVAAVTGNLTRSGSSDANGASTIAALPAGTYSVTPSAMTGRTTPVPQTVTVGAGAANANFVYLSQCAVGTGGN